jgi:hypothetical protein
LHGSRPPAAYPAARPQKSAKVIINRQIRRAAESNGPCTRTPGQLHR